jgi:pterin-4a-carbinolamine dehydratase
MTQPLGPAEPAGSAPVPVTDRLKAERIQFMARDLPAWEVKGGNRELQRSWAVPTLRAGTALADALAAVVQHHRHHATITITPDSVAVALSTPAVNGLSAKDFHVAAALEFGA